MEKADSLERTPVERLQFALIIAICILYGADLGLLGASFKSLEEDLGMTPVTLGLMGLAQASAMALAGPVWGWLCDTGTASRRELMSAGAFGWGCMVFGTGLCQSASMLVLCRLVNGACLASLMPLSQGWVADLFPSGRRGSVYGYLQCAEDLGFLVSSSMTLMVASKKVYVGTFLGTTLSGSGTSIAGWRIVCFVVGALSIALSICVRRLMTETPVPGALGRDRLNASFKLAVCEIAGNLRNHWTIPTFRIIIYQGVVGSIPWNAMNFETMFLLYVGFSPLELVLLSIATAPASLAGGIVGGYVGDWAARRYPYHGRALTAMVSVGLGIPTGLMITTVLPDIVGPSLPWYIVTKTIFSLTATWCFTGVNRPLLNDIVDSRCRASIIAWDCALEGTVAAVFGMPFLGLLAEKAFGYTPTLSPVGDMAVDVRTKNMLALQSSLAMFYVVPWTICFICYSGLLWTYQADMEQMADGRKLAHESTQLVSKVPRNYLEDR